jgi:hypothetical protein
MHFFKNIFFFKPATLLSFFRRKGIGFEKVKGLFGQLIGLWQLRQAKKDITRRFRQIPFPDRFGSRPVVNLPIR